MYCASLAELLRGLGEHVEQAAGVGLLEAAAGEAQPVGELVPLRRPRASGRTPSSTSWTWPLEVLVRDVAATVADQQPALGQQIVLGQLVERRDHHALGEIAGRAEENEDRRACIRAVRHAHLPVLAASTRSRLYGPGWSGRDSGPRGLSARQVVVASGYS